MKPFLLFSHPSTVCSTISQYKSVFSFVPVDSSVQTKDLPEDAERTTGRNQRDCPFVSFYYLRSYVILSVLFAGLLEVVSVELRE